MITRLMIQTLNNYKFPPKLKCFHIKNMCFNSNNEMTHKKILIIDSFIEYRNFGHPRVEGFQIVPVMLGS